MAMATNQGPQRTNMSPLPRDMRLSPRCNINPLVPSEIESPNSSILNGPRGMSPFARSIHHSRQSSALSNQSSSLDLSLSSSSFYRQGSGNSFDNQSRMSSIASPFSMNTTTTHSRQSSTDSGGGALTSKVVGGARRKHKANLSQVRNSATPPPHKLPPFTTTNLKMSPTSMDMGYHTMPWDGTDSSSPLTSMELSPCPTNVKKPLPPKVPNFYDSGVNLDMSNQCVEYKTKRRPTVSYFSWLPDELIVRIFSYLNTSTICHCSRVCRRFYFLSWDPVLWQEIQLSGDKLNADLAISTLLKLVARDSPHMCLSVEKISFQSCSKLTDSGLWAISRSCPSLQTLVLKSCKSVTNAGLQNLVSKCSMLTHLNVTGCSQVSTFDVSGTAEPSPATAALVGVPPGTIPSVFLQYLDLTDCPRITDLGLGIILKVTPNLQHLYLRRCLNFSDMGIKYIASHCPSLRELSISDCVQITDFGLYELAKLGPNLRYLSVAKCDQISDSGVMQIAKLCYKLRYLNVRGCEAVSDDSVEALSRSCTRLRSLDLGKCDVTDVGLKLLAENCPGLKKLSVKSCEMISDQGLQNIAYRCRGLQQLNIQDSPITIDGYRMVKKFCSKCIIEHTNPGFY